MIKRYTIELSLSKYSNTKVKTTLVKDYVGLNLSAVFQEVQNSIGNEHKHGDESKSL